MGNYQEALRIEYAPEYMVSLIAAKTSLIPEDTLPFWRELVASVRVNGYTAEQLKSILKLNQRPIMGHHKQPVNDPFLAEFLDLAINIHTIQGTLHTAKGGEIIPNKRSYFNQAEASLFFLRRGSLTYPPEMVKNLDLSRYQAAVNSSYDQLYLAFPPYDEFFDQLDDIILNDICRDQLECRISIQGKPIN